MRKHETKIAIAALAAAGMGVTATAFAQGRTAAAEVYRLTEVNGGALPVVVEQDERCREELLGGTLTLETDGRWRLMTQEREVCGADVEAEEESEDGIFTREGQTIRFLEEDGEPNDDEGDEGIDAENLSVGTVAGGALTVRLADGATTLTFRQ